MTLATQTGKAVVLFLGKGLRPNETGDLIHNGEYGIGFFRRFSLPQTLVQIAELLAAGVTANGSPQPAINDLIDRITLDVPTITHVLIRRADYDAGIKDGSGFLTELARRSKAPLVVVILEPSGAVRFTQP